ncbi:MAG: DUF58 domain-containing protein [Anaerolineales bacterium]|nr:DUF58 domain-containing protein [Anaerolineales bacterium]
MWARISLTGVHLDRDPRSLRAQVGSLFVERFRLKNTSRTSKLWVEARDDSNMPGYRVTTLTIGLGIRGRSDTNGHRASTVTVDLGPGHLRSWDVRTICTRRGRYRLGPMILQSSDPFGLFPTTKEVPYRQNLVVLPLTVPIRSFPIPSGRLPGGDALRQRTHQVTPNAASVRDYAPGDSLNRIHWPSTAKRRRLIVKEFEFDPLGDVWILLDASHKVQYTLPVDEGEEEQDVWMEGRYTLPPSTEEYAVAVAASLSLHFLELDRAVGLVAYGQARHVIQPHRGESQLYRILESLAVINAVGRLSIGDIIKVESPRIPRGSTVIVITPAVGSEVLMALREFEYSARQPVLILLEADSFGGPSGSQALSAAARREGVSIRNLRCGDDLEAALSAPSRVHKFPIVV